MIFRSVHIKYLVLISFFHFYSQKSSAENKPVDVVFCMDLSGSTNGLIDDLRDRLWDIILQFQSFKPAPRLRIGFVAYSRPSFGKTTGYSKIISPLSDDFDQLAFDLFNIRPYIEKGDQMVGSALQLSVRGMNWNKEPGVVKIIFLVGNGGVQFGPVDFRAACDEAAIKQMIVFPVFCTKSNKAREITGWLEMARLGQTELLEIYIHKKDDIQPVCKDMPALKAANDKLNRSFVYYGEEGFNKLKLLKGADSHALLGGALSFESRVFYKIKNMQSLDQWDLVDYMKQHGGLPVFDHGTLADTLSMIPDDNLKRTVMSAKDMRLRAFSELQHLLPLDRQQQIKKQRIEKNLEKSESLELVVVKAYINTLVSKGFQLE